MSTSLTRPFYKIESPISPLLLGPIGWVQDGCGVSGHHPSTHQDFLLALADRSMTIAPSMKPVGLARTVCPGGMTSTLEGGWDLRNLLPLKQYVLFDKVNSKTIQIQRSNLGILGLDFESRHWGGPLHDWRTGLGVPGGDSNIGLRFPQPWISFRSTTPCDFKWFFGVHIFCNPCIWDMWWSWRFRGFKQLVWNGFFLQLKLVHISWVWAGNWSLSGQSNLRCFIFRHTKTYQWKCHGLASLRGLVHPWIHVKLSGRSRFWTSWHSSCCRSYLKPMARSGMGILKHHDTSDTSKTSRLPTFCGGWLGFHVKKGVSMG